jgi:putative molybdopterin biosynthesis protein
MNAPASAARQEQFLEIVSKDEALRRFQAAYPLRPLGPETVPLAAALGRVLAGDIAAPSDAPPFDRSVVDGFAVRSADTAGAAETRPVRLALGPEVIACGHAPGPAATVAAGTATVIATGGMIPRGADAVVMVEWTDPAEDGSDAILVRRAVAPGQAIAYAGSDIARGETVLRRGVRLSSREIGVLAGCGVAAVAVARRPKVAVISTGDELIAPGRPLEPAAIYDSNSAILAATVAENGGEPVAFGVIRDDAAALEAAIAEAVESCDMVVLSGGTSKGAGDLTYRMVADLGAPGIIVHGVALKPGKPLLLAVSRGIPLTVLPGFPTSAIFTFRTFLVPTLRAMAGLPASEDDVVTAKLPVRVPSEVGRTEFVMVTLTRDAGGLVAHPTPKGSGAVTSFSQADGFVEVPALADGLGPMPAVPVTRVAGAELADLAIVGSHCIGLDVVVGRLAERGIVARTLAIGSQGGLAALKRGECDLAPIHLKDASGVYNAPFLGEGLRLVPGWRRRQGLVFRTGDSRFENRSAAESIAAALADPACVMVNRNPGAGTRIVIDGLIGKARPSGWHNQPRSHNAVAAAIAQGRADWGVAIETIASAYGLGFVHLEDEHYDFALHEARADTPAVRAFLEVLAADATTAALREKGFEVG